MVDEDSRCARSRGSREKRKAETEMGAELSLMLQTVQPFWLKPPIFI